MENENSTPKKKSYTFFTVLVILLLIVIAISSVINTYYLLSINTKLSLLPKMDKAWVSKYAPKADLSLYSSMHFYRLPNTVHSETGKKKVLIEEVVGNNTLIDYPEISTETFRYEDRLLSPSDLFNDGFITNSIWGFHNGNRDNNMFKLIKRLSEFGGREFVEVFVRAVNAQSDPPLDNERIEYMLDYHLGEGND